jgi:hypothetical protein
MRAGDRLENDLLRAVVALTRPAFCDCWPMSLQRRG